MEKTIQVLMVEDNKADAELNLRELKRAGLSFDVKTVAAREALEAALAGAPWDVILCDYNLPGLGGVEALALARGRLPECPVIMVSGSIGEEKAVEALQQGATDYVLKDRLARLGPAVQRALKERAERSERARLEEQLRQAQKMEAVGQLAAGVAHDFNNLVTAITGFSELLLRELPPEDPKRADVEEIRRAGQRAAALTRQLLAFGRRQVFHRRLLDLNAVVAELEGMLRRVLGEHVDLACRLRPGLGAVMADSGAVEQVVVNLAVNARDAMPRGGRLTIETSEVELDADYAASHAEVAPGPHVMLAVSDTGTGMDAATQARIFEPFFTTKPLGKGTGLGLATVHGIVKQSGGHVFVYSEPGKGTTFKVYLPLEKGAVEEPARSKERVRPLRGVETIMLVEDEDSVRALASRVLEARNGEEALALNASHRGPLHLVLTDVVMPGVGGRELVVRMALTRPGLKALFMSGYTNDGILRMGALNEGIPFMEKPFTTQGLLEKVRQVLDAPGAMTMRGGAPG